jgi:hypothetical protein
MADPKTAPGRERNLLNNPATPDHPTSATTDPAAIPDHPARAITRLARSPGSRDRRRLIRTQHFQVDKLPTSMVKQHPIIGLIRNRDDAHKAGGYVYTGLSISGGGDP